LFRDCGRVLRTVGHDDISVRSSSTGAAAAADGSGGASNQVVAVGKRLSDRLHVVYEQGPSVANNALKIEYSLTRSITLRAEARLISGVGIYYRRSWANPHDLAATVNVSEGRSLEPKKCDHWPVGCGSHGRVTTP
jgi:hypothetical protein